MLPPENVSFLAIFSYSGRLSLTKRVLPKMDIGAFRRFPATFSDTICYATVAQGWRMVRKVSTSPPTQTDTYGPSGVHLS